MKLTSILLSAPFALMAMAAPTSPDRAIAKATSTQDTMASVCTNGLPASKQHPAPYPITDYTVVTPDDGSWTSYALEQNWFGEHFVSGPHVSSSCW